MWLSANRRIFHASWYLLLSRIFSQIIENVQCYNSVKKGNILLAYFKQFRLLAGDKYRDMSFSCLLNMSLPYAEVSFDGQVRVAKARGSGGVLNISTCSQQLLYEIGNPAAYVTPDVVCNYLIISISRYNELIGMTRGTLG